jgi:hypothetical protein
MNGASMTEGRLTARRIATAELMADRELAADIILGLNPMERTAALIAMTELVRMLHWGWCHATGADTAEQMQAIWQALTLDIEAGTIR